MDEKERMEELAEYIVDLCQSQNLSLRRASIKAQLAPETLTKIVTRRATSKPRPDTLRLIAEYLHGDFEHMMRLAGYLPPPVPEAEGEIPTEARELLDEVLRLWVKIKDKDPDAVARLALMARTQAEMVAATIRHQEERASLGAAERERAG